MIELILFLLALLFLLVWFRPGKPERRPPRPTTRSWNGRGYWHEKEMY